MSKLSNLPALGVSIATHVLLLFVLYLIKLTVVDPNIQLDLETVFEPERLQEEFTKELEIDPEVAQNFNVMPGGVVTSEIGASTSPVVTQNKVDQAETLQEPTIEVSISEVTLPAEDILGKDFGESEITGEVGAAVEGYGAAMSRITMELARMMRQEKILVVWLFDESGSMKDDQKEIAANFHEVYEELGIITKKDEELRKRASDDLMQTAVLSFGASVTPILPKPTSDVQEILDKINQIPVDESGKENMCQTISASIDQYIGLARRQDRRLVLIVVSDESGDDGDNAELLENTVLKVKKSRTPVYFMGRESMFGYPYARLRWTDPKTDLPHWLRVRRGPETPQVECLQWDGLHDRWDTQSAGFGPYAQVRLARESGGIYFILPGEEEDLVNAREIERRKYEFLDMKEYQPVLEARRQYIEERDSTEFRKTLFQVIMRFDPEADRELRIREHWYPLDINEFREEASREVVKAAKAMALIEQAIPMLDKIRPLRDTEPSERWRANYDLAYAQLVAFRLRLFQYLLAMDQHANTNPKVAKENHNRWNLYRNPKDIVPDEEQYGRLKAAFKLKLTREEFLAEFEVKQQEARQLLQGVIDNHPGTPWERRAKYELSVGFGMGFTSVFRNPAYDQPVTLPNL